jgi:hypothetical protein
VLGEAPCTRGLLSDRAPGSSGISQTGPRIGSGIAGLAPSGPFAFVVACESGVILKITGQSVRD